METMLAMADGGAAPAEAPLASPQVPVLAVPALTPEEQRARRRERLPSLLLAARQQQQQR